MQDDLNECEDREYFEKVHLDDLRTQTALVVKLLNGYIRYLRSRLSEKQDE